MSLGGSGKLDRHWPSRQKYTPWEWESGHIFLFFPPIFFILMARWLTHTQQAESWPRMAADRWDNSFTQWAAQYGSDASWRTHANMFSEENSSAGRNMHERAVYPQDSCKHWSQSRVFSGLSFGPETHSTCPFLTHTVTRRLIDFHPIHIQTLQLTWKVDYSLFFSKKCSH